MDTHRTLEAALHYAGLGYSVFPCLPTKAPYTPNGCLDATTDAAKIKAWWTYHPAALIGLATTGLLVIDVDGADNRWPGNPEHATDLLACGGISHTAGGGRHYIFRQPAGRDWRNTASKLAQHVDTRANGGYIIVPPSTLPDGRRYEWVDGMELDAPLNRLPEPPDWLTYALNGRAPLVLTGPIDKLKGVGTGARNQSAAEVLGGILRRYDPKKRSDMEAAWELAQAWNDRNNPPLPEQELRQVFQHIARAERAKPKTEETEEVNYRWLTGPQLDSTEFHTDYHVDNILARCQPCVIAGPSKALKTSIAVDLAISCATGTRFLNHFWVPEKSRVAVMTGESGMGALQGMRRRILESKNLQPNTDDAIYSEDLPIFGHLYHLDAIRAAIEEHHLDLLIVDPLYLAMPGANTASLTEMGQLLRSANEVCAQTRCTLVLIHHTVKHPGFGQNRKKGEPLEREDIHGAAVVEWCRQWILVNRRTSFNDTGTSHELWLAAGGSAGHNGLWQVDIDEGEFDTKTKSLSCWHPSVESAMAARKKKAEQAEESDQEAMAAIEHALQDGPVSATALHKRVKSQGSGMGWSRFSRLLEELAAADRVIPCPIRVSNHARPREGWQLPIAPYAGF